MQALNREAKASVACQSTNQQPSHPEGWNNSLKWHKLTSTHLLDTKYSTVTTLSTRICLCTMVWLCSPKLLSLGQRAFFNAVIRNDQTALNQRRYTDGPGSKAAALEMDSSVYITNLMIPIQCSLRTDLDGIKEPGVEGGRVEDGANLTQHLKRSKTSHCVFKMYGTAHEIYK